MKKTKTKSGTLTEIKHGIKLVPQQIIIANLIQASNEDLERIINEELQQNVALESDETRSVDEMTDAEPEDRERDEEFDVEDEAGETEQNDEVKDLPDTFDDDGPLPVADNRSKDEEYFSPITNYGDDVSFRQSLKEQVGMLELSERDRFLANYLVESLEDDGYLRRPLQDLVSALAWNQNFDTTEEELQRVLLEVIQANLEPVGVGARDLRECLLLQLYEMTSTEATMKTYRVLDEAFDDFMRRRFETIKENLGFTDRDLEEVKRVVHHLNPKPGGMAATTDVIATKASKVRPDFIVTNEGRELIVSLCNTRIPAVRVSPDYCEMLQNIGQSGGSSEEVERGRLFIESGIRKANIFISALVQRRNTLLAVMRAIARFQYRFFVSGNVEDLRPMAMREIAALSKYDISTVSRVCSSRYVQTDFNIYPLKALFSRGMPTTDKGMVSTSLVKSALREIIEGEDKRAPYNDDELQKRLEAQGYHIARRTVVKYRSQLGYLRFDQRVVLK